MPRSLLLYSGSNGILFSSRCSKQTSIIPPTTSPAPSSSISWQARSMAADALLGSSPLSNFPEASVCRPRRLLERRMFVPSKQAASKTMVVTSSVILEFSPPMIPAMPISFSPSQIIRMSRSSFLSCPSRVSKVSPSSARRTMILCPAILS